MGEFGPAGMLEVDDGENWQQGTLATKGVTSRRHRLNYAMGLGRGEFIEEEGSPPRIETGINENTQLWFYQIQNQPCLWALCIVNAGIEVRLCAIDLSVDASAARQAASSLAAGRTILQASGG